MNGVVLRSVIISLVIGLVGGFLGGFFLANLEAVRPIAQPTVQNMEEEITQDATSRRIAEGLIKELAPHIIQGNQATINEANVQASPEQRDGDEPNCNRWGEGIFDSALYSWLNKYIDRDKKEFCESLRVLGSVSYTLFGIEGDRNRFVVRATINITITERWLRFVRQGVCHLQSRNQRINITGYYMFWNTDVPGVVEGREIPELPENAFALCSDAQRILIDEGSIDRRRCPWCNPRPHPMPGPIVPQ